MKDGLNIQGEFTIYEGIEDASGKITDWKKVQSFKNAVVNAGGARMAALLIGAGGTSFASSWIGVGDSATAVAIGQTDLQASTNKFRKACDATFPSISGQVVTWEATFASGEANYQWNEMAVFNASTAGTMFARGLPASPITKTSGATLKAVYQITFPATY